MVEPQTFYLVSCVGKKRSTALPAKDVYASEWFFRARAHVERTGCQWFILSAKYGLLDPSEVIRPYELTLNDMPRVERQAWADRVKAQMMQALPPAGRCVILAGQRYREFLAPYLSSRFSLDVPMQGLAIGQQLQWLGSKQ